METVAPRRAPYLPFKTFLTGIESLQTWLPERLDRSVWPTLSYADQAGLMSAFAFLGLIDNEGTVQPVLRQLVNDPDSRKAVLKGVLEAAYPEIMRHGLARMTPDTLATLIREFGNQGDAVTKGARFLINAAKYLELPISPALEHGVKTRRKTGRKRMVESTPVGAVPSEEPPQRESMPLATIPEDPREVVLIGLIHGLPRSFPNKAAQERWVAAFRSTLEAMIPVDDEGSGS